MREGQQKSSIIEGATKRREQSHLVNSGQSTRIDLNDIDSLGLKELLEDHSVVAVVVSKEGEKWAWSQVGGRREEQRREGRTRALR